MNINLFFLLFNVLGLLLTTFCFLYIIFKINKLGQLQLRIGIKNSKVIIVTLVIFISVLLYPLLSYISSFPFGRLVHLSQIDPLQLNTLLYILSGLWMLIFFLQMILLEFKNGEVREKGVYIERRILEWKNIEYVKLTNQTSPSIIIKLKPTKKSSLRQIMGLSNEIQSTIIKNQTQSILNILKKYLSEDMIRL